MGCTARTARRRRKQAANGFKHMSPLKRPHYKKRSLEASARRLSKVIEKQKLIATRKGQKAKK